MMVYVKHKYGSRKKEIIALLRQRLRFKERMRYHKQKHDEFDMKLLVIERKIKEVEGFNSGVV
jgi:hypothetical protein